VKITRDWLAHTRHCPDGLAFALTQIGPDGLELSECWPLVKRADWIVSLAVQSGAVSYADARYIVERILRLHAREVGDNRPGEILDGLSDAKTAEGYLELVGLASAEAYTRARAQDPEALDASHRMIAAAFVVKADLATTFADRSEDADQMGLALERLQSAAYSIGLSLGDHEEAAELFRSRVLAAQRRAAP
jgi:hypothetical protein